MKRIKPSVDRRDHAPRALEASQLAGTRGGGVDYPLQQQAWVSWDAWISWDILAEDPIGSSDD